MGEQINQDNFLEIRKIASNILSKWYILLISISICLAIAYLVNRYTTPVYFISTSVYVKQPKENPNIAALLFERGGSLSNNLSTEIIKLNSYSLVETTINSLNLGVTYYKKGKVRNSELYKDSPILVIPDTTSSYLPYDQAIHCYIQDDKSFFIQMGEEGDRDKRRFLFGKPITIRGFRFTIYPNQDALTTQEVIFKINNINDLILQYQKKLNVFTNGKESTVITLALESENPAREIDFLDKHVINFIHEDINEKNIASNNIVNFINKQLVLNTDTLNSIESQLEAFKDINTPIDLSDKGSQIYADIKSLEQEKASLVMANRYFGFITNNLLENKEVDQIIIPPYLSTKDPGLETTIEALIATQLENKLLKSDNKFKNPFIEVNDQKIKELKNSILRKIEGLVVANNITINEIERKINTYLSSQKKLPAAERKLVDIKRNYVISESLVQFLMEKRAEAEITRASNTSDFKIVDKARLEGGAIKPRPVKNYVTAFIVGLIVPIGCIFIIGMFNNKIITKDDILKTCTLPFIGTVVRSKSKSKLLITENQRTPVAESFRSIRSNLSYLTLNGEPSKIILLTSAISGEGKTFCSENLACILAAAGKKVLLINADMRKIHDPRSFKNTKSAGLSNFLSGRVSLVEIVSTTNIDNLYYISSGDTPPNPSELLLSNWFKNLLTEVNKNFDYIILDTPPIGILSDGLELMKHSDINIIVMRQNITPKSYLQVVNELYNMHKIKNMAILFNDVDFAKESYGYNVYNYAYYKETKKQNKFWSFAKRVN